MRYFCLLLNCCKAIHSFGVIALVDSREPCEGLVVKKTKKTRKTNKKHQQNNSVGSTSSSWALCALLSTRSSWLYCYWGEGVCERCLWKTTHKLSEAAASSQQWSGAGCWEQKRVHFGSLLFFCSFSSLVPMHHLDYFTPVVTRNWCFSGNHKYWIFSICMHNKLCLVE